MGRYDGEEFSPTPACRPSDHKFGMNGECFKCRRSKTELLNTAVAELQYQGYSGMLRGMSTTPLYLEANHKDRYGG